MSSAEIAQALATAMTFAIVGFATLHVALSATLRRDQARYLALFLALYATITAGKLFLLTGGYHVAPHLAGAQLPLKTLLGPAIYFYTLAMTARSPKPLTPRDALALTGPLLVLFAAGPFYLLPAAEKVALADLQTRDPETFALALTSCALALAIFILFSFGYLAAAIFHLRKHQLQVSDHNANIECRSLNRLFWMLLILATNFLWHAGSTIWGLSGARPGWANIAAGYTDLAFIAAFALCGLMQRPAYGSGPPGPVPAPYARSTLSEERMKRIATKLTAAVVGERMFENPDLSLRLLSDHLGVSENYLSETFNRHLKTNFFDFVNARRVEAARRQLMETNDTILTIAHAVGFNSRSTFNAAFKKHAGLTPSALRKQSKGAGGGIATPSIS